MFNKDLFDEAVKESGLKICVIQIRSGLSRNVWHSRVSGMSEFRPSEIVAICSVLNLTRTQREAIFGI